MSASFQSLFSILCSLLLCCGALRENGREPVRISSCLTLKHELGNPYKNETLVLTKNLRCDAEEWRYPASVVGEKILRGESGSRMTVLDLSHLGEQADGIVVEPGGHLVFDGLVLRDRPLSDGSAFRISYVHLEPEAAVSIRQSYVLHSTCPEDTTAITLEQNTEGLYHICGTRVLCGQQIFTHSYYTADKEMEDACKNYVRERATAVVNDGDIGRQAMLVALGVLATGFTVLGGVAVWVYRSRNMTERTLDIYVAEETRSESERDEAIMDFTLPSRRITIDEFSVDLDHQLGVGGFGTVYSGRFQVQNKRVAVKVLIAGDLPEGSHLHTEANLSIELRHTNIVRTYATRSIKVKDLFGSHHVHGEDDCTLIFMEHCDKGELSRAIDRGEYVLNFETLKPKMCAILHCAIDIAKGIRYLHAVNVVHGDIKPDNILRSTHELDPRGYACKICDFGLSKRVDTTTTKTDTLGMISYMPPEMLRKGRIGKFTDVYSFGMLLWELLTSDVPYSEVDYNQILMEAVHGRRPAIPESTPASIKSLIKACWNSEYTRRPTATEIVRRLNDALSEWYASFPARSLTTSTSHHVRSSWRSHAHNHARSVAYSESILSDTAVEEEEAAAAEKLPDSIIKSFSSFVMADFQLDDIGSCSNPRNVSMDLDFDDQPNPSSSPLASPNPLALRSRRRNLDTLDAMLASFCIDESVLP